MRALYAFRVAGLLYGADVLQIQEVCPCPPITPVPQAPAVIRGLANLRSHIYLVLDMRAIIGRPPQPLDAECRLVVIKPGIAGDLGLVVERGVDIVHVQVRQIELPPKGAESDVLASLFPNVCRMESDIMTVMDLAALASVVQAHYGATPRTTTSTRAIAPHSRETSQ